MCLNTLLLYMQVHNCDFFQFYSLIITGLADRFEEYPKLKELIRLKASHAVVTVLRQQCLPLSSTSSFFLLCFVLSS